MIQQPLNTTIWSKSQSFDNWSELTLTTTQNSVNQFYNFKQKQQFNYNSTYQLPEQQKLLQFQSLSVLPLNSIQLLSILNNNSFLVHSFNSTQLHSDPFIHPSNNNNNHNNNNNNLKHTNQTYNLNKIKLFSKQNQSKLTTNKPNQQQTNQNQTNNKQNKIKCINNKKTNSNKQK